MKKTARIAVIFFAAAIIFTLIGGIMVSKAKVNASDIYDIFKDDITIDETSVNYTKAEPADMSEMHFVTVSDSAAYQLNEFNSLNIYADYCDIAFVGEAEDSMDSIRIAIEYPEKANGKVSLKTAVDNGTLYIQNEWADKQTSKTDGVVITVNVPEIYKGGYSINGSHSDVELENLESAMNTSVNLYDSTIDAKTVSAQEVTVELSGTSGSIEKIKSSDSINISSVSSDITVNGSESIYTMITANSTTLNMNNIAGGITAELSMCRFDAKWAGVNGTINVNTAYGRTNLTVPKNSPVALHHDESYAVFNDDINWSDKGSKNKDSRYFIDTNVKFGIVTLSEK